MRALHRLILGLCLVAGLLTGAMAHGAETASFGEVTQATAWLHAEGDHDQVPADADRNYPHHHNVCHSHDVAAQFRQCDVRTFLGRIVLPRPAAHLALTASPPGHDLRPPIA